MSDTVKLPGPGEVQTPVVPLRDMVVFPQQVLPLFVGRPRSVAAVEAAAAGGDVLVVVTQRHPDTADPAPEDLHDVGTLCKVIRTLQLPDATIKLLVEGQARVHVESYEAYEPALLCRWRPLAADSERPAVEAEALMRSVRETFEQYVRLGKRVPPEALLTVANIEEAGRLADAVAGHLALKVRDKQALLELVEPCERLDKLNGLLHAELEILLVEKRIRSRVKKQMARTQKEYLLNEQMTAIQKELGERDDFKNEIAELDEQIRRKNMSKEAKVRARRELHKLKLTSPMSAEATVMRNYIDWILALPWNFASKDSIDLAEAERLLDEDHYGLTRAKERILEYLAVQSLVGRMKGPILCFVGPPGVGKTSLARSIGRATGRKYVRVSLGGVRDEAEIRGHRRTYIGAMPGKILQGLRTAGTSNPVFLLDEIDKMNADFRGDPASALLEVLDPEQNQAFNDHYLDLDYDLSRVMFITTANNLHNIPIPLQDRMEIIELSGYTEYDKLHIAQNYLVPKQREANGLADVDVRFRESALRLLIHRYTREAGVRNLEREIAAIARKVAREVLRQGKHIRVQVTPARVARYLGPPKFRYGQTEEQDQVGLCLGLAVTLTGGDLLATEVSVLEGKGKLTITGKLGDVMQESAQAALSYVRSRAETLRLDKGFYQHVDIHIHCPEGAIPKDGPSAGITMATALASALSHVPVRRDVALTGEITLRGRVLPVGGLKEKVLAAHRAGVKTVIVPAENRRDLEDIPANVRKGLRILLVDHMDEVLRAALPLPPAE